MEAEAEVEAARSGGPKGKGKGKKGKDARAGGAVAGPIAPPDTAPGLFGPKLTNAEYKRATANTPRNAQKSAICLDNSCWRGCHYKDCNREHIGIGKWGSLDYSTQMEVARRGGLKNGRALTEKEASDCIKRIRDAQKEKMDANVAEGTGDQGKKARRGPGRGRAPRSRRARLPLWGPLRARPGPPRRGCPPTQPRLARSRNRAGVAGAPHQST